MNGLPVGIGIAVAGLAAMIGVSGCVAPSDAGQVPGQGAVGPGVPVLTSANNAQFTQIAAALRGTGVRQPYRWTRVVIENRPYDPDDYSLIKLREALARYGLDYRDVFKLVSVLEP